MQDAWRSYLELALGFTEASRKKAMSVARTLTERSGVTVEQLQQVAEDLTETSAANREALVKLIRYELDRALAAVGLATAEEVGDLTRRIRDLETNLRDAEARAAAAETQAAAASRTAAKASASAAGAQTTRSAPTAGTATKRAAKKTARKTARKTGPATVAKAGRKATVGGASKADASNARSTSGVKTAKVAKKTAAKKSRAKRTPGTGVGS